MLNPNVLLVKSPYGLCLNPHRLPVASSGITVPPAKPFSLLVSGWFLIGGIPIPLKNMKVRLDHHPNLVGENKIHLPNHQAVSYFFWHQKSPISIHFSLVSPPIFSGFFCVQNKRAANPTGSAVLSSATFCEASWISPPISADQRFNSDLGGSEVDTGWELPGTSWFHGRFIWTIVDFPIKNDDLP